MLTTYFVVEQRVHEDFRHRLGAPGAAFCRLVADLDGPGRFSCSGIGQSVDRPHRGADQFGRPQAEFAQRDQDEPVAPVKSAGRGWALTMMLIHTSQQLGKQVDDDGVRFVEPLARAGSLLP